MTPTGVPTFHLAEPALPKGVGMASTGGAVGHWRFLFFLLISMVGMVVNPISRRVCKHYKVAYGRPNHVVLSNIYIYDHICVSIYIYTLC